MKPIRGFRGEGQTLRGEDQCLAVWGKDSCVMLQLISKSNTRLQRRQAVCLVYVCAV